MKNNCLNCHFFCKELSDAASGNYTFSLTEDDRKAFEKNPLGEDRGFKSLKCYMGVWNESVSPPPTLTSEDKILFSQDRGNSCFFITYKKSMLLPAAVELQKRGEVNRQLKTSYRLTIIGLWIAALGLIINAIVAVFKAFIC